MSQSVQVVERPILFSGEMVRAILEGKKSQTRRVVAHRITGPNPPKESIFDCYKGKKWVAAFGLDGNGNFLKCCPYGKPGDRLWVRETFSLNHSTHYAHDNGRGTNGMIYRASWDSDADFYRRPFEGERRWRPSSYMPRWASRLTLEIVKVRVERLQEISKADCIAEGMEGLEDVHAGWHQSYAQLWDSINSKRGFGWDKNPWVWAITFQRVRS